MAIYNRLMREPARRLFDLMLGSKTLSARLGVPPGAVRKWKWACWSVGRGGPRARYNFESFKVYLEVYIDHWNHARRQIGLKSLTPTGFRVQALWKTAYRP